MFALGSLVGRVILVRTTLAGALVGLSTMFVLHAASGWLLHRIPALHRVVENRPILLVAGGEILAGNARRAGTSEAEIEEKLRLSGVGSIEEVAAAVIERTGDISIIRAGTTLDVGMFGDVEGVEFLEQQMGDPVQHHPDGG